MIKRTASAGTTEHSDCLVTVSPCETLEYVHEGANAVLFSQRNHALVDEVLKRYGLSAAKIHIHDEGALEVVLKARLEIAIERASA